MKNKMPYTLTVANEDQNNSSNSPQYGGNNHILRAQLPNQQRTIVSIPAGMTIREALYKALKLRKLEPDMCAVYRLNSQCPTKQQISWDVEVAMLKGDEIVVETKDRAPIYTQLSHDFQSLMTLSKCHFCQGILLSGIRCLTCGIEFHRNCSGSVPKLCEPAIEHNNYYRHLLARSSGFSPTSTISTSESPTNTTRPIRPRARSADENSKHKSKSSSQQNNEQNSAAPSTNNSNNNNNNNQLNNSNFSEQTSITSANVDYYHSHQQQSDSLNHSMGQHHHYTDSSYNSSTSGNHSTRSGIGITLNTSNHHQLPTPLKEQQQLSPSQNSNRELLEEKWEIDGKEVHRGPRIGQGSFATVYKGTWHGPVALKELNVKNPTSAQLQSFKNEVLVLKKTRHANILLFLGYTLKPDLMIVTQWCKGRSLYKHLHVEERKEFTNYDIIAIATGVAQGMEYLHAKNILHRDLKSNNIFIHDEDDFTVKIGDFGLATFKTRWEGDQQIYHPTGSILWMAPEVIRTKPGHNSFTFQSDVYSYGIVLYELLSRKLPYFDFKYKEALLFLIGSGDPKRSPKLNLDVIGPDKPDGLKVLMLNCIERDTANRPLFGSIIRHLKKIRLSQIPKSRSEPLRLNDLIGSLALETINY